MGGGGSGGEDATSRSERMVLQTGGVGGFSKQRVLVVIWTGMVLECNIVETGLNGPLKAQKHTPTNTQTHRRGCKALQS